MPAAAPAVAVGRGHAPLTDRLCMLLLLVRASCDPLLALTSEGGGMGLGALLNALMLLAAARYALLRPQVLMGVVLPMWAPYLLAALASVAVAPQAGYAFRLWLVQASYCAAFALPFWLVRDGADRLRWLRIMLWSSALPVCWALLEWALGIDAQGDGLYRLQATFSHPNIFAFYLVLMMAMLLYLLRSASPRPRRPRLLWAYMLLLLMLLVQTKTRSAWAGCLLMFVVYGVLAERRFLLYAALAPALLLLDADVRGRLLDVAGGAYDRDGNMNSYAWRVLLWRAGLRWMDGMHVLYGYGLESFRFYSPRFFPLQGEDSWDPHNVYVQLYFETGALGLAAYGWLFWRLLRRLYRAGATIALAAALSYLLASYSDNMLFYLSFNWYFWFFAGSAAVRAA